MKEIAAEMQLPLNEQVRAIIADFLDRPPEELEPERRLEEFNVDSFDFIELCFLIEEKTGLEIKKDPLEIRAQIETFADIYRLVEDMRQKQAPASA